MWHVEQLADARFLTAAAQRTWDVLGVAGELQLYLTQQRRKRMDQLISIDVFADVACPWCYIGMARLEHAMAQRSDLQVERRWRPFQLQPGLPAEGVAWDAFAAAKFGGAGRAQAMYDHVASIGAADGLTFRFDLLTRAPNTRDAQRVILFARQHSLEWPMATALFRAYFAEGRDLSARDDLLAVAHRVGLPREQVAAVLDSDMYVDDIAASQQEAQREGISGVPFYVIDGRYGVEGAQTADVWLRAFEWVREQPTQRERTA